jgi:hypothetical protein
VWYEVAAPSSLLIACNLKDLLSPYHQGQEKYEKSLIVCSILRVRSWIWSHWIILLVAVDFIPNSMSLVPY